jgi:hypothetical protein
LVIHRSGVNFLSLDVPQARGGETQPERRCAHPSTTFRLKNMGGDMTQPRAADDFTAIRTRMEELRRERAQEPEQESRSVTGPREEAEKRAVSRNLPGFSGVRRRVG